MTKCNWQLFVMFTFCHMYCQLQPHDGNGFISFSCFRWYSLFSGVRGCLGLPITLLKLQR